MNASASGKTTNSGWITYIKGVAFLAPAVLCWVFGLIVPYPKVIEMWQRAGPKGAGAQRVMDTLLWLAHNSLTALEVVIIALILFELFFRRWARYRPAVVSVTVFLLNTAILVGLTAMCLAAAIAHQYLAWQLPK
jgi:phosphoglycerol transferase MdoB-like AlkP superfamily enzyme